MLASRTAFRSACCRRTWLTRARNLHDLHNHTQSKFLKVSEEVRDAVATGKPVVALETTIYTHGELRLSLELEGAHNLKSRRRLLANTGSGFPYPDNIALASLLESVVRANGGVPATVGVLGGVARVGMSAEEIMELASTAETKSALKVSRRDLGYICGMVCQRIS